SFEREMWKCGCRVLRKRMTTRSTDGRSSRTNFQTLCCSRWRRSKGLVRRLRRERLKKTSPQGSQRAKRRKLLLTDDLHGIDAGAIDFEAPVQMRAGHAAGGADFADHIADLHFVADFRIDL